MTSRDITVRHAMDGDVVPMNQIYNRYIVGSHVSFDTEPWTDDQRRHWLAEKGSRGYPVLVAEQDGLVVAAAWSGPWRAKTAYARSAETTIVVGLGADGAGIGSHLYKDLIHRLSELGFHRCFAVVALPNDASIGFHHKLGFTDIGVLDEAGFKDGAFVSTLVLQLKL